MAFADFADIFYFQPQSGHGHDAIMSLYRIITVSHTCRRTVRYDNRHLSLRHRLAKILKR